MTNSHRLHTLLLAMCLMFSTLNAEEEEKAEVAYIMIEPIIITNFQRKKGMKPGFVQLQAEIAVYGKHAFEAVEKHLPLIRATIIEVLSFTDEETIKDVSKRQELRKLLTNQVNQALEEQAGYAYADDLVITHFMWG